MQVKLITEEKERKRHQPTPEDLKVIEEIYGAVPTPEINHKDVECLIKRYALDPSVDLYTIADVLHLTYNQVKYLLKKEEFKEIYKEAKEARSQLLLTEGYNALRETYDKSKNEEVTREQVNASKNFSNYCLAYSRELTPKEVKTDGAINVQINLPVMNHINIGNNNDTESN